MLDPKRGYQFAIDQRDRRRRANHDQAFIRSARVRDPFVSAGSGGFAAIQTAAASFGVELAPVGVRDADEIKRGQR